MQRLLERHARIKHASGEEKVEFLEELQANNVRMPAVVVDVGVDVIKNHRRAAGDRIWDIHESVAIAGLDLDNVDIADEHLKALAGKFPESRRVLRLQAHIMEAMNRTEDAVKVYEAIINKHPEDDAARKRRAAIARAEGDLDLATRLLKAHLALFGTDMDAWVELASVCEHRGDFAAAAFCIEEVVVSAPLDAAAHTRLGELIFSANAASDDPAPFVAARQHLAQALELRRSSLRAASGLCKAAHAVAMCRRRLSPDETIRNAKLFAVGKAACAAIFAALPNPASPSVLAFTCVLERQATAFGSADEDKAAALTAPSSAAASTAGVRRRRQR